MANPYSERSVRGLQASYTAIRWEKAILTVMVLSEIDLRLRKILTRSRNEVFVRQFLVLLVLQKSIAPDDSKRVETLLVVVLRPTLKPYPRHLEILLYALPAKVQASKIGSSPRGSEDGVGIDTFLFGQVNFLVHAGDGLSGPQCTGDLQEVLLRLGEVLRYGSESFGTRSDAPGCVVDAPLVVDFPESVGVFDFTTICMELHPVQYSSGGKIGRVELSYLVKPNEIVPGLSGTSRFCRFYDGTVRIHASRRHAGPRAEDTTIEIR